MQTIAEIARQAKFIDGKLSNPHSVAKNNVIGGAGDPLARQAADRAGGVATAARRQGTSYFRCASLAHFTVLDRELL